MVFKAINALAEYGIKNGLIEQSDRAFTINRLLEALNLDGIETEETLQNAELCDILKILLDYAAEHGIIDDNITARDLFDTKLMGLLTPRPSYVIGRFKNDYERSAKTATDNYYKFSCDTDYIRRYRISRDVKWKTATEYGELDITINLSKPEKDPKAIAAAKSAAQCGYPKCMLCRESEGYRGRGNFPARQNHRIIPLTLCGTEWFLQYSPYVYYNEHCIVLNSQHTPMKIEPATFAKLFSFVEQFPHYFLGSNADLPIVGGSILTHDHFQGGNYEFAMAKAEIETPLFFEGFSDINAGIVKWPMSVIRLISGSSDRIVQLSSKILAAWRKYTDESAFVFAETDGTPHNTITPIARKRNGKFEMDLVLRNNITTPEHPLGVFHPHSELHHIKKENIGLIEVMGLAVLPARLKAEMAELKEALISGKNIENGSSLEKHREWAEQLKQQYTFTKDNADEILQNEIGKVFAKVLEHAGVFKRTEDGKAAFLRFAESV